LASQLLGRTYPSHAHPGGWWHRFLQLIQLLPQAHPFVQILRTRSALHLGDEEGRLM
jgi:hypothetical protein